MIQYYRSFTMRFREEFSKLNEIDDSPMLPGRVRKNEVAVQDDDLNKKLMAKINVIAQGLADAFKDEGIELDAQLIVDDIKRDCGLMGDVISTDELDVENNPFDAATKQMHDMGPVDRNHACQTLLNVPPHEFVSVIINGLKRGRGLLPGGAERRAIPNRPMPRRIGEAKEKDYSYINELVDKYASQVKECKEELENCEWKELKNFDDVSNFAKDTKWCVKDKLYYDRYIAAGYSFLGCEKDGHKYLKSVGQGGKEWGPFDENDKAVDDVLAEEVLTEKIQDLKAYFKKNLKDKFEELGLSEREFMKIAALDPTYKKESPNIAGDYIEWLLRMITKKVMTYQQMMEIGQEWHDVLHIFDDYKKRNKLPADRKDIMRFKTFDELFSFLQSLGGDITVDAEEGTSFRSAIKNIRGALVAICGFRDEDIPSEIQNTEDALTFCGEANGWELYRINSVWGAMLADTYGIDWGAGATWCTGGQYMYQGQPRKGQELLSSAKNHYGNYTRSNTLYFFASTDNSILRPKNKIQLQLGTDGYKVGNVFHANDNPLKLDSDGKLNWTGGYGGTASGDATVLAAFMKEYGLIDMVKHSPLSGCESIKDAETAEKLARGEPYEYNGEKIKDIFKQDIKEIVFKEGYDYKIKSRNRDGETIEIVGIQPAAFANCTNLKLITLPVSIVQIGIGAFKNCNEVKIVIPRYPDREFKFYPSEQPYFEEHLFYDDGQPVFGAKKKEPEETEGDSEEKPEDEE